jgi:hypothetical protein
LTISAPFAEQQTSGYILFHGGSPSIAISLLCIEVVMQLGHQEIRIDEVGTAADVFLGPLLPHNGMPRLGYALRWSREWQFD